MASGSKMSLEPKLWDDTDRNRGASAGRSNRQDFCGIAGLGLGSPSSSVASLPRFL